jgi:hypothetical protein
MPTTLPIRHTWDGEPIADAEAARVVLDFTPEHLVVEVDAPFHGDPPPSGPAGPTDELWRHEVVEVFVAGADHEDGAASYTEVELSPWGHHLVLELHGVRQIVRRGLPLDFRAVRDGDRWHGVVRLARELLPLPPYRVNAYAVHGQGEERRYLAAFPVPGAAPDFHRLEHFRPIEP